jgi:hypothetical protein
MPPVAFDRQRLIAGRPEVVDDVENRLRQPFGGDITAVIELQRKQNLESPPLAAPRSLYPSQ